MDYVPYVMHNILTVSLKDEGTPKKKKKVKARGSESGKKRCDSRDRNWCDVWPRAKECRRPLEARKGWETFSPRSPEECSPDF